MVRLPVGVQEATSPRGRGISAAFGQSPHTIVFLALFLMSREVEKW